MGLLDFLNRRGRSSHNPTNEPGDLIFKSSEAALEYVQKSMDTEWAHGRIFVGIVSEPFFCLGTLAAPVLIPNGKGFRELDTVTTVKAISSPQGPRVQVTGESKVDIFNLRPATSYPFKSLIRET